MASYLKKCTKCNQLWPRETHFHRQGNGKRSYCVNCVRDYNRAYHGRSERFELLEQGLKQCAACGEAKSLQDFYKNGMTKDGMRQKYTSKCKPCKKVATYAPRRNRSLRKLYGISQAEYELMANNQGWGCVICKDKPDRPLVVDHDHTTGVVRGLLCDTCNRALGMFKDNTELLINAVSYLERSKNER